MAAWLVTSTPTFTTAPPAAVTLVWIVGPDSSLAPTGRIVTGPLIPPQLNQVRWKPSDVCSAGLRQSIRTVIVWAPAESGALSSKGRYGPTCEPSEWPSIKT